MKIAHLTAGTGNFHCGTCLRDHALVTVLNQLGHEAIMAPMYLPFVLEQDDRHTGEELYFGGINVFLQSTSKLFRHTPRWLDRLFDSRALLRKAADRTGMTKAKQLGRMTLSLLKGEQGDQVKEVTRLTGHLLSRERPDAICLSNALLVGLARQLKADLAVPVVCTLQGEDTFLDSMPQPYRDQCWQELAERSVEVDAFIAVSEYHRGIMQPRMHLRDDPVHVVHNGIDPADYAPADASPSRPTIGYLARLCYPKGLHALIDAFIELKRRDSIPNVKLHVVGAATPSDQPYVKEQTQRLRDAGVMEQVTIETNVPLERKAEFLRNISVLSVPATYGESFGLYVLEAWASGVPVVQPDHAAFPELMGVAPGGILCRPDDVNDLADGLERLLTDEQQRRELGERGRQAVLEHFNVERMGRQFAQVLQQVTNGV